jgi:squalene-hopene/tetraprenyl-beta-curcumene cyclase
MPRFLVGFVLTSVAALAASSSTARAADDESPPKHQYEFEQIQIPHFSANEPVVPFSLDKALTFLNQASTAWNGQRKCVACHTNGIYMTMRPALAPQLGEPDPRERDFFVRAVQEKQKQSKTNLQRGTTPEQIIYAAAGLAEWDRHLTRKLSPETDAALRLMFSIQRKEGSWRALDCWPPYESDEYHPATVAAMAVAAAPEWLASLDDPKVPDGPEMKQAVDRLRTYLRETPPPHDYARVLLLWSALRMPDLLEESARAKLVEMLLAKQQADGGWSIRSFAKPEQWGSGNRAGRLRAESEFAAPPSDGHMTGLAVIVLRESGLKQDDPRLVKAVGWIKANQRSSGRWWTRSLNTDQYHFIAYSGTAFPIWALALCDELPAAKKTAGK